MNFINHDFDRATYKTQFIADFLQEKFGAKKLALLRKNQKIYFELVAAIQLEDDNQKSDKQAIEKQMSLVVQKTELENQRLELYAEEHIDGEKLRKIGEKLFLLEEEILANEANLFNSKNSDDKKQQLWEDFLSIQEQLREEDYSELQTLLKISKNNDNPSPFQQELKEVIKAELPKSQVQEATYDCVALLLENELKILWRCAQNAARLAEQVKNSKKVDVSQHECIVENIKSCENYLESIHGMLYMYLETLQSIDDEKLINETTATFKSDQVMAFSAYQIIQKAMQNNLSSSYIEEMKKIQEKYLAKVDKYTSQPNPIKGNNRNSAYAWRDATKLVLYEFGDQLDKQYQRQDDITIDNRKRM